MLLKAHDRFRCNAESLFLGIGKWPNLVLTAVAPHAIPSADTDSRGKFPARVGGRFGCNEFGLHTKSFHENLSMPAMRTDHNATHSENQS
jgi:hypothetical protein